MNMQPLIRQDWFSILLLSVYAIDVSYCVQTWPSFQVWLTTLPYLHSIAWLVYPLTLLCILTLTLLLLTGQRIVGWYLHLWLQLIFVGYLCVALLTTDDFFLPYHGWWKGMRWWDRMVISLIMAWSGWIAIRWQQQRYRSTIIHH